MTGLLRLGGLQFLARALFGVLAFELVDAAGGVDQLLLAREERVAARADFDVNVGFIRSSGGEDRAAGALHGSLFVLWMNSRFHGSVFTIANGASPADSHEQAGLMGYFQLNEATGPQERGPVTEWRGPATLERSTQQSATSLGLHPSLIRLDHLLLQ
jgi:hypothetical protein